MAMKENKPMRVALYCRVAHESQLSIEHQKQELTQYARSLGYGSPVYYTDNGASGFTLDCPGFRQMEVDIQAGSVGTVLVTDFSRLGRDMWQVLRWGDSVKRKGVAVLSMRQPGEPLLSPITESLYKAYASQRHNKRR